MTPRSVAFAFLLVVVAGSRSSQAADAVPAPEPSPHDQAIDLQHDLTRLLMLEQRSFTAAHIVASPIAALRKELEGNAASFEAVPSLDKMATILSPKELASWTALFNRASKWFAAESAAVTAEEDVRTRIVLPLCEAHWGLDGALADIAREKANPSGVVDLVVLHTDGESVQYCRTLIASLAPLYAASRHHAYTRWQAEGACVEEYQAHQ